MKFLCSNCKAKYQIPDEKIAGRTLKMDCRRCNTPITIRGDQPQPDDAEDAAPDDEPKARAGASASARARPPGASTARPAGASATGSSVGAHPAQHPASQGIGARTSQRSAIGADFRRNVGAAGGLGATEAPRVTPLDQWHVAINDVPVGPMKRDEIARKIQAGAANADSLAWREGFDDWRPIREIPELAALLRRASAESERPAPRPGAARAPAPRAPAPRGAMPAPAARSPIGAGPARSTASARNNVVPIGGRAGASAAPSYEPDDGDEGASEGETTTIASAADLGLGDFGKVRDDGDIPSPSKAETAKLESKPKGLTGGLKPVAPPSKAAPVAAKPAAAVPAAAIPAARTPAPKPAPAPVVAPPAEEDDDAFGLPPIVEPKRASFAPPPPAAEPLPPVSAAVARPVSVPAAPPRDERRAGLGVGAMMGIGFAMAAGGVLMYGVVQRFVLSPPPPTTTIVATVATITPPPSEAQHEATLDDSVPPPSSTVAAPVTDVPPPPSTTAPPTSGSHHVGTGTGTAPPPTSRTTPAHPPTGDDPFAQFADDGANPAPLSTTTTAPHHDDTAAHHSSSELTAEQISAVRRSGQRGLTTCWETALRAAGHVDGDVRYDIDITIGTSGRVTVVHARGPTTAGLQDCLERGVRRWVFPPSASETQTTFPIVFSAQQ